MHLVVIKDEYKKQYYVLNTPYLPEFYSIIKRKSTNRYKLKVFEDTYSQRLLKILYVKYLLASKYKYRHALLKNFLGDDL